MCDDCKEVYKPQEQELRSLDLTINEKTKSFQFYRPVGCNKCSGKGYVGRTLIEELLLLNDEVRSLIMQRQNSGTLRKQALKEGMVPIRIHGIQKIIDGVTSVEEVLANTQMD